MSRFGAITMTLALLMWAISLIMFINYSKTVQARFQEKRLEQAMNYATDAAVDIMIETSVDVGLDYADYERAYSKPDAALEGFLDLFCKNYGMSINEANLSLIKSEYLKMFCLAAFDGYYLAEPYVINDAGARDLIFSLKQPYIYTSPAGVGYALTIDNKDAKVVDGQLIKKVNSPLSDEEKRRVINALVSDAVTEAIQRAREGNLTNIVSLPTNLTDMRRTNPIDGITVLAYVSDMDIGSNQKAEILGIGGARVSHAEYCACYMRNGMKMYSYVESVPTGVNVIATYEKAEEAAENGYYFDLTTVSY